MSSKTKTHFKEVHESEKISKLSFLSFQKVTVIIWEKTKSNKHQVECVSFDEKTMGLEVKNSGQSYSENKDYLFSFMIQGMNYFGALKYFKTSNTVYFKCEDSLYKSEKRQNYRLLTYPHYKSYIEFKKPRLEVKESNVVDFKTKQSQTGIFKSFLKLVNEDEENINLKLRVFDLSVRGLALLLNETQKEILEEDGIIKNFNLFFLEHDINIPKAKISYCSPLVGNLEFNYKMGLEFLDIDTNFDSHLGNIINTFLRENDSEFEEFIK